MKEFKTKEEAKAYGKEQNFSKRQWEKVMVNGKKTILCGTCIPYEDTFYPFAEDELRMFGFDDDASDLRDALIEAFEAYTGYEFLDVWDEF